MIVIAKRVGRLANRMLLFSHLIAAGREHGFSVLNPAFEQYASYFPSTSRNLVPRFPPGRPLLAAPGVVRKVSYRAAYAGAEVVWRLQQRGRDVGMIRLTRDQELDLNSDFFVGMARRHRVLFIQDWFFRNQENVARHAGLLRSYFTPHRRMLERARAAVEPARERGRLVIGVHIRRGDYASFKEGRFLFSHDTYREAMERARAAHADRDVAFLVCADEPQPPEAFAGLEVIEAPGDELEDLYALASCDRLIGPPSTYNRWASFWGEVPLVQIRDPGQPLEAEMFHVAHGLQWEPLGTAPAA
jgi:hypothetical protein